MYNIYKIVCMLYLLIDQGGHKLYAILTAVACKS